MFNLPLFFHIDDYPENHYKLVGRSVRVCICHNFLKGRQIILLCSYRSTCLSINLFFLTRQTFFKPYAIRIFVGFWAICTLRSNRSSVRYLLWTDVICRGLSIFCLVKTFQRLLKYSVFRLAACDPDRRGLLRHLRLFPGGHH